MRFRIGFTGVSGVDASDTKFTQGDFRLPGVFGVAQDVAGAWTDQRGGPAWMRHGRSALQTAAILKSYHAQKTGKREQVKDAVRDERERRGLAAPTKLSCLDGLAWRHLGDAATKRYKVGQAVFVEHDAGAVFFFPSQDMLNAATTNEFYLPTMWILPGREEAVKKALSEDIWRMAPHGLELLVDYTEGEFLFYFNPLKAAGAYVDRPANGHAPLLANLAYRLQRFRDAGYVRKVLFHGAPGCGKSTLARMLAVNVGDGRVVRFDPKATRNGDSSHLQKMLDVLTPSVVLLDDMDRATGADGLLSHLEEANSAIVVGTVNSVSAVDPALLRPGRFDEVVEVNEPDAAWRAVIVDWYVRKLGVEGLPENAVEMMEGFAPADIFEVLKVCSVVGSDLFEGEVIRLRKQRDLYSGDKVGAWLSSHREGKG